MHILNTEKDCILGRVQAVEGSGAHCRALLHHLTKQSFCGFRSQTVLWPARNAQRSPSLSLHHLEASSKLALDAPISTEEVLTAIKSLKPNKRPAQMVSQPHIIET